MASKKLRGSLDPFILDCLVCVKQGNYFWSEEYMGTFLVSEVYVCAVIRYIELCTPGLTSSELIFIKPSKRLGNAKRLNIPLANILRVAAVEVSVSYVRAIHTYIQTNKTIYFNIFYKILTSFFSCF